MWKKEKKKKKRKKEKKKEKEKGGERKKKRKRERRKKKKRKGRKKKKKRKEGKRQRSSGGEGDKRLYPFSWKKREKGISSTSKAWGTLRRGGGAATLPSVRGRVRLSSLFLRACQGTGGVGETPLRRERGGILSAPLLEGKGEKRKGRCLVGEEGGEKRRISEWLGGMGKGNELPSSLVIPLSTREEKKKEE